MLVAIESKELSVGSVSLEAYLQNFDSQDGNIFVPFVYERDLISDLKYLGIKHFKLLGVTKSRVVVIKPSFFVRIDCCSPVNYLNQMKNPTRLKMKEGIQKCRTQSHVQCSNVSCDICPNSGISFLTNNSHLTILGAALSFPLVEAPAKLSSNGLIFL